MPVKLLGHPRKPIGFHAIIIFSRFLQGCKPVERMDIVGGSASASPCSSYHPSPCASYNPSPASSSFPSPASSSYAANPNADGNSLIPWLKNLSSASSSASSSKLPHLYIHSGSISAPVTPPLSSPTARTPRIKTDWDDQSARPGWAGAHYSFLPSSTPPSPGRQILPDSEWFAGIRIPQGGPTSPTFSLVSSNPFGFKEETLASASGSRMWTPGQSGTCSPAIAAGSDHTADVPMSEVISDEFAFGCNTVGLVKPWEGERIHEECGSDDLELTLGSSRTSPVKGNNDDMRCLQIGPRMALWFIPFRNLSRYFLSSTPPGQLDWTPHQFVSFPATSAGLLHNWNQLVI
ncbi:BES1/BZR1-like protein 4 [Vitis vinifera]|uniref:Protein BZR1 homolog n=1 Tax=Vitis vinifera TaxID=29760 RepID=A0A438J4Q7_VITVI|nr:BES1/BZR1-like protein 4 [Vitis vinifera]